MNPIRTYYVDQSRRYAETVVQLRRRNRLFVVGELLTFIFFLALIALSTVVAGGRWILLPAVGALFGYTWIRMSDVRNDRRIRSMEDLHSVYEHEISYLDGDFTPFDAGAQYLDPHDAFTYDLDIFGRDSLFQRMNRTITTGGSDRLASYLSFRRIHYQPENIRAFAEDELWRARFMSIGQRRHIDSSGICRVLTAASDVAVSRWLASPLTKAAAIMLIVGLLAAVVLAAEGTISVNLPIVWAIVQFFAVYTLTSKALRHISKIMEGLHEQMQQYIRMIRLCTEKEHVPADLETAFGALREARISFERMEQVIDGLDRRGNVMGLFLMDTFLLGDLFLIRRFIRWQQAYMDKIGGWIEIVSDVDALVSMGTFRYNEPATTEAEIVSGDTVIYEAEGLCHPFLGDKAVRNDFSISDRHFYIITGANMAGKSTFLRSVGVNYVLALNGMPVFARRLRVSRFRLFSSMRTNDDLSRGISYFNAELLRLRQLIDFCEAPSAEAQDLPSTHTLIILDEILKGTNSLDKLNGSRLFLDAISRLPVSGIVATHDLELSKMSERDSLRFHNFCFEIELGDRVTYSYRITPGVARNQNATFLLKGILAGR